MRRPVLAIGETAVLEMLLVGFDGVNLTGVVRGLWLSCFLSHSLFG